MADKAAPITIKSKKEKKTDFDKLTIEEKVEVIAVKVGILKK